MFQFVQVLFVLLLPLLHWLDDPYDAARDKMVREQIEDRGVRDLAVLRALRSVARHEFLPESLHMLAYTDQPLPIGHGATISQPYIVALMTELLRLDRNSKVLEIGTGSGYQAAVLSKLADAVFTIEIVPELAKSARTTLEHLGYTNVTVRQGDGFEGWPEHAPFDRIILTAAPREVPPKLLDQLARGGRLVAPVGDSGMQELIVVEKSRDGKLKTQSVLPVAFVPMVRER